MSGVGLTKWHVAPSIVAKRCKEMSERSKLYVKVLYIKTWTVTLPYS